jgi:hypothetical protein
MDKVIKAKLQGLQDLKDEEADMTGNPALNSLKKLVEDNKIDAI